MNRHENAAVSHRHQFERRAQKMPMAKQPRRSILAWFAAFLRKM